VESRIRAAGPADIGAVAALHLLSRQATYRGIIPEESLLATTAEQMRLGWAERIARESATHRMFVVEIDDGIRGFAYVGPGDEIEAVPEDTGVLYAIHVHPQAQGQGLGRALMARCVRTFGQWRHSRAVLWALDGNAQARRFYERCGWEPDGMFRDSLIGDALTRQLRYGRSISVPAVQ
jgi:GNAT superfamily N-acetyltransferase